MWPGWIWSIPIAAVVIVSWLAVQQLTARGVVITVVFPQADGISANQTTVVYQGINVGNVESVRLEKDLEHVRAKIRMDPELEGHLGKGTEFWIETPSFTDLSSLRSIIGGPSIGIAPVSGKTQKLYHALADAPVTLPSTPGTGYILHASDLGTVARGSKIYFHGLDVGAVDQVSLEPDRQFLVRIFVASPYDKLVHRNTRFWNAGPVELSMAGAGPKLQLQSLQALVGGAVDFETPERQGAVAPAGTGFILYSDKDSADFAPGPFAVTYRAVLGPSAGALEKGAAVTLAGVRVGTVEQADLIFDPTSASLEEHVLFALEPRRLGLPRRAEGATHGRAAVDALMDRLIARGLRAKAGSSIPLVGAKTVALAFVKPASSAALLPGNPPEVPAAPGGGGIGGILAAVNAMTSKIESLPLEQIADNLKTVTGQAAALSSSGELKASLHDLHSAVADLTAVSAAVKTNVPALIVSLRRVANEASRTVASAHQVINSAAGTGPVGLNAASLGQTLYEIDRAAAAIRQLADYLDRHPSALLRGRQ